MMKMNLCLMTLLVLSVTAVHGQDKAIPEDPKILIVYFSYTGNTRGLAQQIHAQTGGDIVEIELEKPYSKDYKTVEKQGQEEVNSGYQPPIRTKIADIRSYDVIFVGSPVWWFTIAPPVSSFLAQHDLRGKKVVCFVTHGGYGAGHSAGDIQKLAPGAVLLKGYDVEGKRVEATREKMSLWLKELKW